MCFVFHRSRLELISNDVTKMGIMSNGNNSSWNQADSNQTSSSGPLIGKPEAIFWCSVFIIETVLVTAGNLLTTFVFLWSKKLRKRRYYLMLNLAISDALVGALAMPLFVVPFGMSLGVWGEMSWILGDVTLFLDMLTGFASIVFLTMIALERLYATLRPFNYRALKSRWYVLFTIIAWMTAGSIPSLQLVIIKFPNTFLSSTPVSIKAVMWVPVLATLLLLISVSYAVIWGKVRIVHKSVTQRLVEKESSLSRICLLITVVSLVAWLPFVIVNMVFTATRIFHFHVFYITKFLHYVNSLLNPILYVLKIPDFRASLPKLCSRKIAGTSLNELSVPRAVPKTTSFWRGYWQSVGEVFAKKGRRFRKK